MVKKDLSDLLILGVVLATWGTFQTPLRQALWPIAEVGGLASGRSSAFVTIASRLRQMRRYRSPVACPQLVTGDAGPGAVVERFTFTPAAISAPARPFHAVG